MPETNLDRMKVAVAQIAPVWLDRRRTLEKVTAHVEEAAEAGCKLIAFGEALVPGYPFWVERTEGARFESDLQKDLYAHYLQEAVDVAAGDLQLVQQAAADGGIAVVLGTIERASDRGGHSNYCSLVYIDAAGEIRSVHRKLCPTHEERLVWAPGDGHGLRAHRLGAFTVGGLNCWENWMPLARAAMYAQGVDLHVAIWPGSLRNTEDITRFIAQEARAYVISAAGLLRREHISGDLPHGDAIIDNSEPVLANGGSCIAGPDGRWVLEPVVDSEQLLVAEIDHREVRRARHSFDPVGHYSRPDVTRLKVNRQRQATVKLKG